MDESKYLKLFSTFCNSTFIFVELQKPNLLLNILFLTYYEKKEIKYSNNHREYPLIIY